MKTLYFDCSMGAAGDMMVASLLELMDDPEKALEELNGLSIPKITFIKEEADKCGITGTHIRVLVDGEEEGNHDHDHHHHHDHDHDHHHDHDHDHHHHSSMHNIEHILNDHVKVSEKVKRDVLAVYSLIAQAESKVHNTPIDEIHFHEVGTMDAVADITAACYLIDKLNVDEIYASPIHVGKGEVKCAHGILPVPAPATALILKDVPIYSKEEIDGELCTPTGAALLKHFVKEFKSMPELAMEKIGYGMGKKDFPMANCLRAILGEGNSYSQSTIKELDFNVDDMTGEEIGLLTEMLLENGATEVFVTPVYMKKNRPGSLITVLCTEEKEQEVVKLIFKNSTTIGIRESLKNRFVLERKIEEVETSLGRVRKKETWGYGVSKSKYEHDDLARIACEKDLSLQEVLEIISSED